MILLKHIFETCISPASIVTFFLLVALLLAVRHKNKNRRGAASCLALAASLQLLFLCTPLGEMLIGRLERQYSPLLEPEKFGAVPWIVVLSAYGVEHPATPITNNLSEETLYRLVEAVRLYKRVPKARLIVSGGVVRFGEKPIAELMAEFLLSMGIPAQDILTEGKSKDTYENLVNTQQLVGSDTFFLVTSAYHLRRAMAVAEHLNLKAIACPAYIQTLQHHPPQLSWWQWSL
ncbi:MAG: YdcF family protein, partial [Acidobacteria bacterium]|nr:YdcF family protein [Acidobacteriota bacterium]